MMKIALPRCFWIILIAGFLSGREIYADVRVSATLADKTLRVGESAQIYVEIITDGGETASQPVFPKIDGLTIRFGNQTSNSTRVQFINGKMTQMHSQGLVYMVQALKEGTYTIAPITVTADNRTYKAAPLTLTVLPSPPTPQPKLDSSNSAVELQATQNRDGIILAPEINKQEAFVGEEIQLTFIAYFPVTVDRLNLEDKRGHFQNFWVESVDLLSRNNQEHISIQGRQYIKVPIRRYFLYPLTAGEHTIQPLTLTCDIRQAGRFGFFTQGRSSTVDSIPIPIKVNPLPQANRPDIFQGAVGQFTLSGKVSETTLNEGNTVTLEVILSGFGNMNNAPEPVLPDMSRFDVFDPTKDESISVEADGVSGSVKYNYVILPHGINSTQIGPVRYAYFDPEKEEYLTLSTDPIELTIFPSQRNGIRTGTSGANRRMITRIGEDFRFIAVTPSALVTVYLHLYRHPGYWAALVSPLALVGLIGLYRKRKEYWNRNPEALRSRRAPKLAEKLLFDASRKAQEGDTSAAYAAMAKAVTDYIGNRWNVSCAGLTGEALQQKLNSMNIPDALSESILILLQTCDLARFSGSSMDVEKMRHDLDRAKQVISGLAKIKQK